MMVSSRCSGTGSGRVLSFEESDGMGVEGTQCKPSKVSLYPSSVEHICLF